MAAMPSRRKYIPDLVQTLFLVKIIYFFIISILILLFQQIYIYIYIYENVNKYTKSIDLGTILRNF